MKKYLISNSGNFYKANLHVHTNVSDGINTPIEVKKGYKDNGYSVVAFTDHEVFVPQNQLSDDDFIAINAVEIAVNDNFDGEFIHKKTYHLNLYAKDKNQTECSLTTANDVWCEQSRKYITPEMLTNNCEKTYSINCINNLIKKANEEGFLVCYNHPVWSLQDRNDYIGLKGLWGIEVYNTGSFINGYEDTVQPFEDLLRNGEAPVPVAADDSHNLKTSAYGGWTMIKAPALTYNDIITALSNGECYSSTGPEILELYIEKGIVNVKTSKAVSINLTTDIRVSKVKRRVNNDYLTEASFDISNFINEAKNTEIKRRGNAWFRIEVKDESGNKAYTRAYFVNEI